MAAVARGGGEGAACIYLDDVAAASRDGDETRCVASSTERQASSFAAVSAVRLFGIMTALGYNN